MAAKHKPPINRESILAVLNANAALFRDRYGVCRIGLFGSYARGDYRSRSDVDILVVMDHPTYRNYFDLKTALEREFGRSVDLVTDHALKPLLRDAILSEVIYAAEPQTIP
jgi:predicted nucleotidyltransferase